MAKGSVRKKGKKMILPLLCGRCKRKFGTERVDRNRNFTGLRLGEAAGLTWQDINFEEQYLTVRRSVRYNSATHKHEIGSTKRKKVRVVDFGNALADILKKARKQQLKNRMQYGGLCHRNFYREVTEKKRVHYEYYSLGMTGDAPEDYTEISFVCLRKDGKALKIGES